MYKNCHFRGEPRSAGHHDAGHHDAGHHDRHSHRGDLRHARHWGLLWPTTEASEKSGGHGGEQEQAEYVPGMLGLLYCTVHKN